MKDPTLERIIKLCSFYCEAEEERDESDRLDDATTVITQILEIAAVQQVANESLPASEVITKEQQAIWVEEAFREAYKLAGVGWSKDLQHLIENGADHDWLASTARKRLEGE